jgi:hypothetical protein
MPFTPFDTQYSAHTDVTIHPVTGVVTITVAFHPNNRGGYNCKIWELHPPYTGEPVMVRDWVQGKKGVSVGPFGHGASVALPTGGLLTVVPVAADSSEVKPSIMIDAGLGAPYALGGSGNDPRVDALVSQLGALGQQIAHLQAGGGIVLLPAPVTTPAWEGRKVEGGVLVDVPSTFGVPSAAAYLIRFVAQSSAPNVRVRAGTEQAPYFVTVNTQAPGLQMHCQGWTPGPDVYVSSVNGVAQVWLQVLGHA